MLDVLFKRWVGVFSSTGEKKKGEGGDGTHVHVCTADRQDRVSMINGGMACFKTREKGGPVQFVSLLPYERGGTAGGRI